MFYTWTSSVIEFLKTRPKDLDQDLFDELTVIRDNQQLTPECFETIIRTVTTNQSAQNFADFLLGDFCRLEMLLLRTQLEMRSTRAGIRRMDSTTQLEVMGHPLQLTQVLAVKTRDDLVDAFRYPCSFEHKKNALFLHCSISYAGSTVETVLELTLAVVLFYNEY